MLFSADASSGRSALQRLRLLVYRLLQHKPVRFVLIGGINTVFGYGLFAATYLLTHHRLRSLIIATVLGVTFNFFTTGRLVFTNKGVKAVVPFVLVYAGLFVINAPLLEALVRIGLPTLLAQAIVVPVMATLSYLINRYWVFRPKGEPSAAAPGIRSAAARLDAKAMGALAAGFAGLCLLLAVLIMKGRLYTGSTDLAQHYELARAIASTWVWPSGAPLSSGMNLYPPLSHYLAAAAGLAFHSTLMGMTAVTAATVFLCYLLLARTLSVGRPLGVAVAIVVAAGGLWLARSQGAAEGFEVYGNFFYAQLVGEGVFLLTVLWMSDDKRAWGVRWSVAAILTFISGWLYLITAVEIALAYLVLEAMLLIRKIAAERTLRPASLLPLVVGGATLPLLVYLHPYFHRMMVVANHDGGLELQGLQNLVPECAAVLLVVGLVLGLTRPKGEHWRRPFLFLAVAGCATASAALAQTLVFEVAHVGSPYAVKKYAFATVTLLVFGIGALTAARLDGRRPAKPWPVLTMALPPLFALAATVAMPPLKPQSLGRFIAYQKEARALLRDPRTPRDAYGNTASLDEDFSPGLNHLLTMVDLGMGQRKSLEAIDATASAGPEAYVLMKAAANTVPDNCLVKTSESAAVAFINLNCGPLSTGELQFSEDLSKLSFLPRHFVSGWSVKEPDGVWSDGPKAQIALHFDHPVYRLKLSITGHAFLPTASYVQHVKLSAGDTPLADWAFDSGTPGATREVIIPANLIVNGDLKLNFDFPNAIRPDAPGNPGAFRQLGFFVNAISMEDVRLLRPGDRIDLSKQVTRPGFLGSGWSGKEHAGVWTSGHKASMLLQIAEGDWDPVLVLEGKGFFPTPDYKQQVRVRIGSTVVCQWTMDAKAPSAPPPIVIPRRLIPNGELAIDFDLPNATSPAAHKLSVDGRDLAFFITAVGLKGGPTKRS